MMVVFYGGRVVVFSINDIELAKQQIIQSRLWTSREVQVERIARAKRTTVTAEQLKLYVALRESSGGESDEELMDRVSRMSGHETGGRVLGKVYDNVLEEKTIG